MLELPRSLSVYILNLFTYLFIYLFILSFKIHDEEEVGDKIGVTLLDKVNNALDVGVDVYPV